MGRHSVYSGHVYGVDDFLKISESVPITTETDSDVRRIVESVLDQILDMAIETVQTNQLLSSAKAEESTKVPDLSVELPTDPKEPEEKEEEDFEYQVSLYF